MYNIQDVGKQRPAGPLFKDYMTAFGIENIDDFAQHFARGDFIFGRIEEYDKVCLPTTFCFINLLAFSYEPQNIPAF